MQEHELIIILEWAEVGDLQQILAGLAEKDMHLREDMLWTWFKQVGRDLHWGPGAGRTAACSSCAKLPLIGSLHAGAFYIQPRHAAPLPSRSCLTPACNPDSYVLWCSHPVVLTSGTCMQLHRQAVREQHLPAHPLPRCL